MPSWSRRTGHALQRGFESMHSKPNSTPPHRTIPPCSHSRMPKLKPLVPDSCGFPREIVGHQRNSGNLCTYPHIHKPCSHILDQPNTQRDATCKDCRDATCKDCEGLSDEGRKDHGTLSHATPSTHTLKHL